MVDDKKIKKEMTKLNKIFKDLEGDQAALAERLIKRAAFMLATLDELEDDIKTNGPVSTYTNGNGFDVTQENPAQKSYNTMIRNYNGVIKALFEMLPKDSCEEDELLEFLGRGKK